MLSIRYITSSNQVEHEDWNINESFSSKFINDAKHIDLILASGDELKFILDHFKNIPTHDLPNPPVMGISQTAIVWHGDIAEFIVHAIRISAYVIWPETIPKA